MGIKENDRADVLAKEATDLEPARETTTLAKLYRQYITQKDEIRMDHGMGKQT